MTSGPESLEQTEQPRETAEPPTEGLADRGERPSLAADAPGAQEQVPTDAPGQRAAAPADQQPLDKPDSLEQAEQPGEATGPPTGSLADRVERPSLTTVTARDSQQAGPAAAEPERQQNDRRMERSRDSSPEAGQGAGEVSDGSRGDVAFLFDTSTPQADQMEHWSGALLDEQRAALADSEGGVHVTADASRIGSEAYNQRPSEAPANVVASWLKDHGARARIAAESTGGTRAGHASKPDVVDDPADRAATIAITPAGQAAESSNTKQEDGRDTGVDHPRSSTGRSAGTLESALASSYQEPGSRSSATKERRRDEVGEESPAAHERGRGGTSREAFMERDRVGASEQAIRPKHLHGIRDVGPKGDRFPLPENLRIDNPDHGVGFAKDSSELSPEQVDRWKNDLSDQERAALQDRTGKIIITGMASRSGASDHNWQLSKNRAETVKNVLMKEFGLDSSSIDIVAYGEDVARADGVRDGVDKAKYRIALIDIETPQQEISANTKIEPIAHKLGGLVGDQMSFDSGQEGGASKLIATFKDAWKLLKAEEALMGAAVAAATLSYREFKGTVDSIMRGDSNLAVSTALIPACIGELQRLTFAPITRSPAMRMAPGGQHAAVLGAMLADITFTKLSAADKVMLASLLQGSNRQQMVKALEMQLHHPRAHLIQH